MNRRKFIYSTALIPGLPRVLPAVARTGIKENKALAGDISIGIIVGADNPEEDLKKVADLGFSACQISIKTYSPDLANRLDAALKKYQLTPVTLMCMGPGPYIYNFMEGPSTIGLVPREYRAARVERLKQGIDFCKAASLPSVHAHFGFIPENPKDILYTEFIDVMKGVAGYALKQNIALYFETGQETPITLRRAIEDIGTGNLFVNYDTANLVMYGKANPLDGLKILGPYIKSFHAKDGQYPTNPRELGKEVLIPEGEVNFPGIISFLKKMNFKGNITIECELSEKRKEYLLKTKEYLEKLIASV
ncbi:MAG TPA: sugar phosphate isomerase/epimerase family protein [Puia sp.]|jgi:sugar phosphate isomerase/epimerase